MEEFPHHNTPVFEQRPPWRNIMLLLGFVLVGMSVGNVLGMMLVLGLSQLAAMPLTINDFAQLFANPSQYPHAWQYIMLIQAVVHLFTFLLPSLFYWQWAERHRIAQFLRKSWPSWPMLLLVLLIVLVFMPFNSWLIELNNTLTLPVGLERIEKWMRLKEDELGQLTQFLTQFSSVGRFWVALFVIAVLPAVGEEVLFRGIVQRKIYNKTGDMNVAIWLAAILFSAIHLQFYGFFPRMLLGVIFGYLYAWTRNLWTPIAAHFINNGFTLWVLFMDQNGHLNLDIESKQSSVAWWGAGLSLLVTLRLLFYFKKITVASLSAFKNQDGA